MQENINPADAAKDAVAKHIASNPAYLGTKAAASHCGLSQSYFEKLRLRGDGCPYIQAGRRCLYSVQDLDAWMASLKRASTSEPVKAA